MNNGKGDNHQFWSGFSFGLVAGGALLYFFATPKGRENMKKYLEHADLMEKDISGLLEVLKEHAQSPKDEDGKKEG